jgi:hypothetical protein
MESKKLGKGLNAILDSVYQPNEKLNTSNPPNYQNDPIFKEMNTETIHTSKTRLEIACQIMAALLVQPRSYLYSDSALIKRSFDITDEIIKQENI